MKHVLKAFLMNIL